jgi:hypothetical protein
LDLKLQNLSSDMDKNVHDIKNCIPPRARPIHVQI